jgi:hypothetical protein
MQHNVSLGVSLCFTACWPDSSWPYLRLPEGLLSAMAPLRPCACCQAVEVQGEGVCEMGVVNTPPGKPQLLTDGLGR